MDSNLLHTDKIIISQNILGNNTYIINNLLSLIK